jgi:hypothetical protein
MVCWAGGGLHELISHFVAPLSREPPFGHAALPIPAIPGTPPCTSSVRRHAYFMDRTASRMVLATGEAPPSNPWTCNGPRSLIADPYTPQSSSRGARATLGTDPLPAWSDQAKSRAKPVLTNTRRTFPGIYGIAFQTATKLELLQRSNKGYFGKRGGYIEHQEAGENASTAILVQAFQLFKR